MISYDVSASVLQGYIRKIGGFENVEVDKVQSFGTGFNTTWIIYYKGINQAIPNIILNGASLTGGVTGNPSITIDIVR